MTPERQLWWDSLPKEEKRVKLLIKTLKGNIICCKQSIGDEWGFINADMKAGKNQLEAGKANLRDTKRTIKFLRKQIAMRPVWEGDDEQDYIHCPTCGSVVACCDYSDYELPKHCEDCGQKLRWKKCVD